ncbi:MAG: biotin--[acetyl-CoA-carboxylase] ligase [Gemmatimonadetes bacterium]|nr:biotin--[acetyl-CoA-carboxylase] ligase [Gemmatimonadota bacterium]
MPEPDTHPVDAAPSPSVIAALGVSRCVWYGEVASTMDEAHQLAEDGAPAGTLVLAGAQHRGRGRGGRTWHAEPGAGVWMTLVERPQDASALDVLALRVGLELAAALDAHVAQPIALKWPNDLLVGTGKLAGILIEARWRAGVPEWVAIGVGINRRAPSAFTDVACVRDTVSRDDVLRAAVPAMRRAAACRAQLTERELAAWRARDAAYGRRLTEPREGWADGISAGGALLVRDERGTVWPVSSGSLRFAEAGPPDGSQAAPK